MGIKAHLETRKTWFQCGASLKSFTGEASISFWLRPGLRSVSFFLAWRQADGVFNAVCSVLRCRLVDQAPFLNVAP